MARNRQVYEDVMDVALRATLKEFGFKRKSRSTYIMERPERRWYFELSSEPRIGAGFDLMAAVHVPALDEIFAKHIPGFPVHQVGNRTEPSAHLWTDIPKLMEIAEGHDFYTHRLGPASDKWSPEYDAAQSNPVKKYHRNGWWIVPTHPLLYASDVDMDEYRRVQNELFEQTGRFIDEQWRAHIPAWYANCDDPLFIADWIENHSNAAAARVDLTYAALYHMGGDDQRAARYLQRRIEEAKIPYSDLYKDIRSERGGSWLRQLFYPDTWTDDQVAESTERALISFQQYARAARKLAHGLGIPL